MKETRGNFERIKNEFSRKTMDELDLDREIFEASRVDFPYNLTWQNRDLVYLKRRSVERLLFLNHLFQRARTLNGAIYEFGIQWGPTLAILTHLRGTFDTFNPSRIIRGFDTFNGLAGISDLDATTAVEGDFATGPDYEKHLERALELAEKQSPLSNIKRTFVHAGDVRRTLPDILKKNPQEMVALAFFDLDLYEPTKFALEHLIPRMGKGSILVFDELSSPQFPGESLALSEVLGFQNIRVERSPLQPYAGIVTL